MQHVQYIHVAGRSSANIVQLKRDLVVVFRNLFLGKFELDLPEREREREMYVSFNMLLQKKGKGRYGLWRQEWMRR